MPRTSILALAGVALAFAGCGSSSSTSSSSSRPREHRDHDLERKLCSISGESEDCQQGRLDGPGERRYQPVRDRDRAHQRGQARRRARC